MGNSFVRILVSDLVNVESWSTLKYVRYYELGKQRDSILHTLSKNRQVVDVVNQIRSQDTWFDPQQERRTTWSVHTSTPSLAPQFQATIGHDLERMIASAECRPSY